MDLSFTFLYASNASEKMVDAHKKVVNDSEKVVNTKKKMGSVLRNEGK